MMELGAVESAMRDGVPGLEPDRRCGTCRWFSWANDFRVPVSGGSVTFTVGTCDISECGVVGEHDEACSRWEEYG